MPKTIPDQILWIFLHLRKSGGTTFGAHVAQHLKFDDTFVSLSHWGRTHRKQHHRPDLEERSESERLRIRLISGHQAYYGIHKLVPGKAPRYVTFVRDPTERLVSLYNYHRSTDRTTKSFDSWLDHQAKSERRNPMTKFYAGCLFMGQKVHDTPTENFRAAKAMLDRCWLVTATKHLDEDLGQLFSAMGLPSEWTNMRVAGQSKRPAGSEGPKHPANNEHLQRFVEPTDAARSRIEAEHPIDARLYEVALELREKTRQCLLQTNAA